MGAKGKPDIIDIIEQKRLQWCGHIEINCGLDTTGEKKMRTSRKNMDGRSTSSHDNKEFRTRSRKKQRRMALGSRKTAKALKNRTGR